MNECCKKTYKDAVKQVLTTIETHNVTKIKHLVAILNFVLERIDDHEKEYKSV